MPNDPLRIIRPNLYIPQSSGMEANESIIHISSKENQKKDSKKTAKENNELENNDSYIQKNALFLPQETSRGIVIANKDDLAKYSKDIYKKSISAAEFLDSSLEKIIDLSSETSKEKVTKFFTRLSDLDIIMFEKDQDPKKSVRSSFSPLVMNRETYSKRKYSPLESVAMDKRAVLIFEDTILKSIKPESKFSKDSLKRFGLRFLANSQYLSNLDHTELRQKVIEALATDKEKSAQSIYEHYLSVEADNLSTEQKKKVLETLSNSNSLSSHLAQTIIHNSPELVKDLKLEVFPQINSVNDAVKLFQGSKDKLVKLAMNQVDLVPELIKISPDKRFGIEIEMKLKGYDQIRDQHSQFQKALEDYRDFIELGTDIHDTIAELRTLKYGFPLDDKHQQLLFNVINEFNKSTDLSLFLSNHIHVDSASGKNYFDKLIDYSMENNGGRTWEMKSLDTCSAYLDPQNPDLYYSFNMSNLIDQMVILEELKQDTTNYFSIKQAKKIQKASGLDLNSSLLISQAIAAGKSHIIPNVLRLAESKRAYIETNCKSHWEKRLN